MRRTGGPSEKGFPPGRRSLKSKASSIVRSLSAIRFLPDEETGGCYYAFTPMRFSSAATASVVLITVSGLSDMDWMPHSTKNSANSM